MCVNPSWRNDAHSACCSPVLHSTHVTPQLPCKAAAVIASRAAQCGRQHCRCEQAHATRRCRWLPCAAAGGHAQHAGRPGRLNPNQCAIRCAITSPLAATTTRWAACAFECAGPGSPVADRTLPSSHRGSGIVQNHAGTNSVAKGALQTSAACRALQGPLQPVCATHQLNAITDPVSPSLPPLLRHHRRRCPPPPPLAAAARKFHNPRLTGRHVD